MAQYKLKPQETEFIISILNTFLIFGKKEKGVLAPHNAAFSFGSNNRVRIALGIIIVEVWNPTLQAHMRTDYRDPYTFFADYNGWQRNPSRESKKLLRRSLENKERS